MSLVCHSHCAVTQHPTPLKQGRGSEGGQTAEMRDRNKTAEKTAADCGNWQFHKAAAASLLDCDIWFRDGGHDDQSGALCWEKGYLNFYYHFTKY